MFQAFMVVGWTALMIVLLYLWADVRELGGLLKENKREMLRSSAGGRVFGENKQPKEEAGEKEQRLENYGELYGKADVQGRSFAGAPLNESEERVLKEVLTEFLGL